MASKDPATETTGTESGSSEGGDVNTVPVDESKRTGEWNTPESLKEIAMYAHANCKRRDGVLIVRPGELSVPPGGEHAEVRCEYFKGDRLIACLMPQDPEDKAASSGRPKVMESIVDEVEANKVAQAIIEASLYFRSVTKPKKQKGDTPDILMLAKDDTWVYTEKYVRGSRTDAQYYVWITEGDQTTSTLMSGVLIALFLLITCFPIWPHFMKLGLWYLSVTLLIIIFMTIIIRLLMFLFVWIFGYEFWILPNLFDESLSFVDSFKPAYSFEKTGPGQIWFRIAVLGGFMGFFYWAYTQPTDFDEFLKSNRQFVDDLYEGNLLADISQQAKDDIDKIKIPTIDDLLSDLENEEPGRVENENFLEEEPDPMDVEADVDSMLDSLFEMDEQDDAELDEMDED